MLKNSHRGVNPSLIPTVQRTKGGRKIPIGSRFTRLVVISDAGRKGNFNLYKCLCDCGAVRVVKVYSLLNGDTKSCGCFSIQTASKRLLRHGRTSRAARRSKTISKTWRCWISMHQRCSKNAGENKARYMDRGITICKQWKVFENFLSDMGECPGAEYSLDRIDNNGNYEPGNCRWATAHQQATNMRRSIWPTIGNETKPLIDWAAVSGIKYATLLYRWHRGVRGERLLRPGRLLLRDPA